MSTYAIEIPDECFPSTDIVRDTYYPDERHSSMPIEPIVRCRDCKHYREHEWVLITDICDVCMFFADGVKVSPDGFCAWGERKEVDEC